VNKLVTVVALGITAPSDQYHSMETLHCDLFGAIGDKHNAPYVNPGAQELKRFEKLGIRISKNEWVANGRQLTAITQEEMAEVATVLGIEPQHLRAPQLRANIMFTMGEDVWNFSQTPHGSYITFENEGRVMLEVHWENFPCVIAGGFIEQSCGVPGIASKFPKKGYGKRGVTLKVVRPGKIKVGEVACVHFR
jgi:hypothetical protein